MENQRYEAIRSRIKEAQGRSRNRGLPAPYGFETVKRLAAGRWSKIVELIYPNIDKLVAQGNQYGTCPVCGKQWKFRLFDHFNEEGTAICFSCHPQGGDGIATVAWILDISNNEARELLSDLLQTDLLS